MTQGGYEYIWDDHAHLKLSHSDSLRTTILNFLSHNRWVSSENGKNLIYHFLLWYNFLSICLGLFEVSFVCSSLGFFLCSEKNVIYKMTGKPIAEHYIAQT